MLCLQRYSDRPTLKIREQFPTEHASLKCVLGPILLIDSRVLINTIKLEKYSLDETEKMCTGDTIYKSAPTFL